MNLRRNLLAIAGSVALTTAQMGAMVVATAQRALAVESPPTNAPSSISVRAEDSVIARGAYLATIGGCHDCHTPGFAQAAGAIPQSQWLTGSSVGFKGAWGVSYPTNLRLTVQNLTEEEWLVYSRAERLPPMPWFVLREMTDDDARALYRFFRSLGPVGARAPTPVVPGEPIRTPFIDFMPQNLPPAASN
jgi:mono/diheme cytochrome c family protein